jgi:gas vesicle protein
MNAHTREQPDYGFVIGLLTGTFVGAGLVMWFAPRSASELGERINDSATRLGERASAQYREASARVGEAVNELTRKGQGVADVVGQAVARGANEVERLATAVRSDGVAETRPYAAVDHSAAKPQAL